MNVKKFYRKFSCYNNLEKLLESSIITKSKWKLNGDELICNFPYLSNEEYDYKEFNEQIDQLLEFRNNLSDEDFSWYLAGLIEGDGACSEEYVSISFNIYDTPLAWYIKNRIGEGQIYKHMDKNSSYIRFKSKTSIIKILNLVNGKFYSEYKLNFMKKYKYEERFGVPLLPPVNYNLFPISDNYFLAGFSDADSCFDLISNLYPRYRIIQKDTTIINILQQSLGGKISTNKSNILEHSVVAKDILIKYKEYFDKFPLLSTKYINYLLWKKVVEMKFAKTHLSEEGKNQIIEIKNSMNTKLYNKLNFLSNREVS